MDRIVISHKSCVFNIINRIIKILTKNHSIQINIIINFPKKKVVKQTANSLVRHSKSPISRGPHDARVAFKIHHDSRSRSPPPFFATMADIFRDSAEVDTFGIVVQKFAPLADQYGARGAILRRTRSQIAV